MPGRTPAEAVSAFLSPLKDALRVLDTTTHVSVSPKGGYRVGGRYLWILNGARGADLGEAGTFYAQMEFEVVETDPATNEQGHPLRVSTRSYNYKLEARDGVDRWRMHWHPEGNSSITYPHLHLPPNHKAHLHTERYSWETAIQWCAQHGAPLTCERSEADKILLLAEAEHRLYKTW